MFSVFICLLLFRDHVFLVTHVNFMFPPRPKRKVILYFIHSLFYPFFLAYTSYLCYFIDTYVEHLVW